MNFQFVDENNDAVRNLDNPRPNVFPVNHIAVQEWVDAGGVIAPADPPPQLDVKTRRRVEYAKQSGARRDDFIELLFNITHAVANNQAVNPADLAALNGFKTLKDQIDASIPE